MKESLRVIVERSDTAAGRAFDLAVQSVILVSLVAYSLETLPGLSPWARQTLGAIETATTMLFVAEYGLRLAVAQRPLAYAGSFFGVIDLLAFLPSLLSLGFDARALRALRLLRLFRLLKLARYNAAVRRLHLALRIAWEELVLFFCGATILLYLAAVGIHHFEHEAQPEAFASVFHALWWAVATLTTVGYGDVVPVTSGGRAFTFLVLVGGLGVVATPAGLVASALSKAREIEALEKSSDSDPA
ncbi:Cyclic nucleotide-gated potassium channel [Pseudobythopirellula maris]|uniref:Cyclic nucleotide-gated potassium channel n=1 Tax=Pseudobythopirellula maris TaxID=2527991 RepID=A0A5C5ZMM5_9BACT|nr:ion transporter [Pseudobythopirellula maris]TWT88734.1 Cyclic nucleotide-gated potassium channel [Pseudobythopirellula maris]